MNRRRTVGLPWDWEPWADPSLVRSEGPQRIYDQDAADPTYEPPRIRGFGPARDLRPEDLAGLTEAEVERAFNEPLLWDGDQA